MDVAEGSTPPLEGEHRMNASEVVPVELRSWMHEYKEANRDLLDADPAFEQWLQEEYVPIGGGWQY